ncbi:MAG: hypothetical protein JXQ75_23425 [Phycisphaerae bacterium]|nr:hypothetical protein [Phycisphaerae bacterium]
MRRRTRSGGIRKRCNIRWGRWGRWGKALLLAMAALPVFQTTACYPDFASALSFELQSLVNTVLIDAANIIIQNILGL